MFASWSPRCPIWLILLFATVPDRVQISLAEMARAIPPYTELMEWADGQPDTARQLPPLLIDDPLYFEAYLQSLAGGRVSRRSAACCFGLSVGLGGGAWQTVDA